MFVFYVIIYSKTMILYVIEVNLGQHNGALSMKDVWLWCVLVVMDIIESENSV